MSDPAPTLSVLIVAYNAAGLLEACLDSLAANPPSCSYEVVCVDNASSDGTRTLLRHSYPWVRLIESGTNLGFAGGNVLAASHADGSLLLLLNPDTIVLPGALDALVDALLADERRQIAGACLVQEDGSPGTSWGDFPTLGWALANTAPWNRLGIKASSRVRMGHTCADLTDVTALGWVSGAALLVRRTAWDAVGGMDVGYFLYYEETDLCFRVHAAGGDVVVVPEARIVHLEGAIVGTLTARQYAWSTESLIRFLARNRGLAQALVLRCWIVAVNTVLLAIALVGSPVSARLRRERPRYSALVRVGLGIRARSMTRGEAK